ncbi:Alpha/Beta hydrolase protein [Flammula alnicola]|nr:Alpha/Beta hydrolase protein [Flammula alnicola]
MPYAFRNQPLKGLYLTYQLIAILFVRLPLLVLFNIPKSWRPRKSWTLKRTILIKLVRLLSETGTQVGTVFKVPNHLAITPGVGVNGVWVEPANHLVTGNLKMWAELAKVASIRVPGYWIHRKGSSIEVASPPQPGEKVIYQLHGGGYVSLSAHPTDFTAAIVRGYVQYIDPVQRVFSLEYRLASAKPFAERYPFPTQLLDALAGYNYLIDVVGFASEDIILSGDSAGGNLAHALVRYLTDYQGTTVVSLPAPPGALILLSPWVDLGTTTEALPNGSAARFFNTDHLGAGPNSDGGLDYAKSAFCGPHGLEAAETNAYISPASLNPALVVDFKKFPRTFIVAGGAESLYDSIVTLKDRMIQDLGEGNGVKPFEGKVRYYEAPDGIHDYTAFEWCYEPERTATFKAINRWVTAL